MRPDWNRVNTENIMDSAFLKEAVGAVLTPALLDVSLARPKDPIDYLARLLLKVQQNEDDRAQQEISRKALEAARQNEEENNRIEAKKRSQEQAEKEQAAKEDEDRRLRAKAQRNIQQCQQYALMMAKKRHERDTSDAEGTHEKYLQENAKYFSKIRPSILLDALVHNPNLASFFRAFLLLFNYDPKLVSDAANIFKILTDKRFSKELARMDKTALRNAGRNLRRMVACLKEVTPEALYEYDISIAIMDEFMKCYLARYNNDEANKESQISNDTVTDEYTSSFGIDQQEQPWEFAGTLPILDHKSVDLNGDEKYTIKLGWEMANEQTVDLDAAVICYDNIGSVLDTVYFNKLQSKDGAIRHHGDENDAAKEELLDFTPGNVDPKIESICLVLNCNKEGHTFKDVQSGSFALQSKDGSILAQHSSPGHFPHTGYLLAILTRDSGNTNTWEIILIGEPAKDDEDDGTNFMDAAPICVRFMEDMGIIPISSRSKRQCSNPYAMEKHESYDIPDSLSKIHVGLGWNVVDGHKFDVDCSMVLFGDGQLIDFVNFDKLVSNDRSIVHTGDNMTGDDEGDDEAIKVDYDAISNEIDTAFFVVTIYQEGTFDHVSGTFIRMVDEDGGKELCRYSVPQEAGGYNGLILSKVVRQRGGEGEKDTWKMVTLGKPGHGSTYEELLPEMEEQLAADQVDESVTKDQ